MDDSARPQAAVSEENSDLESAADTIAEKTPPSGPPPGPSIAPRWPLHSTEDGDDTKLSQTPLAAPLTPVPMLDGGVRAWLTVVSSTAALTGTFGLINSIGVFQSYLDTHQLRSFESRDVGWIAAVNIFLCLFLGVQSGPLFDRHGPGWLLAGASVVFVAGMVGMSYAGCPSRPSDLCATGAESVRTYVILMATWGLLCGASAAVITTIALAVVAHWFDTRRGLAVGIVSAGSSIGGVIFPLVMRETLDKLGWTWSVRIAMLIVVVLLAVANAFIRGRTKELNAGRTLKRMKVVDLSCFTDARFVWATLGIASKRMPTARRQLRTSETDRFIHLVFEFVVAATLGVLPTWATARGFDDATAFAILTVYNAYVAIFGLTVDSLPTNILLQ